MAGGGHPLSDGRQGRPLHPWLFTIVANTVRTYHRKRRVRALLHGDPPQHEPPSPNPDSERVSAARQTAAWLEERIRRLPLPKREVVILACIENLPLKEVANVLGLPLGTVKTHLRRARLALAAELAGRGEVRS